MRPIDSRRCSDRPESTRDSAENCKMDLRQKKNSRKTIRNSYHDGLISLGIATSSTLSERDTPKFTDNVYQRLDFTKINSRRSTRNSNISLSDSYQSRPWSWLRLFTVFFVAILSFASLLDLGRCHVVLQERPKGLITSTMIAPMNLTSLSPNHGGQPNRKARHPRIRHQNPSDQFRDGNRATHHADGGDEEKQKMSKAAFRQLSRMAFKALISDDFQDRPLRAPDDEREGDVGESTADERKFRRQQKRLQRQRQRQMRQQEISRRNLDEEEADFLPPPSGYNQRELIDQQDESSSDDRNDRRLPGRRRAMAIATKDSIKPDTCRTVPLKQRVRMTGCTTQIVVSHFCYGQCNSFFIPKLSKKRLRAAFESCSVCKPKTYAPVSITLHCPSRNPPYVKRKIMKVKECDCMPAHVTNDVLTQP